MGEFRVTAEEVSVDEVLATLRTPEIGALASFVGVVRGETEGQGVDHLEFEAYVEMAEQNLEEIGAEIQERWPAVRGVSIVHRTGRLEVGETVVVVAVAAGRRAPVFDALSYAIDRLKEITPIWKKEVRQGGAEWRSES
jgi:molybdopterin synthase catalytic subunit